MLCEARGGFNRNARAILSELCAKKNILASNAELHCPSECKSLPAIAAECLRSRSPDLPMPLHSAIPSPFAVQLFHLMYTTSSLSAAICQNEPRTARRPRSHFSPTHELREMCSAALCEYGNDGTFRGRLPTAFCTLQRRRSQSPPGPSRSAANNH